MIPACAAHLREMAVAVVVVQLRGNRRLRCAAIQRGAIYHENVVPAIAVKIEDRHARAGRLQNVVFLVEAAEGSRDIEPGGLGDVHEMDFDIRRTTQQEEGCQQRRQSDRDSKHWNPF